MVSKEMKNADESFPLYDRAAELYQRHGQVEPAAQTMEKAGQCASFVFACH
jgi:hypothetical protein